MELNMSHSIMCQKEITEPVKYPLGSHDLSGRTDAYVSILANMQQFQDLNALPVKIILAVM